MTKLNQVIAIEKGVKSRAVSELTELYKAAQKPELFKGFIKTYAKVNEDGKDLPQEGKRVQFTVPDMLRAAARCMTELIDVTARKDYTNCIAQADVVVDGVIIVSQAPVTFLLFLEKQLTDLRTFAASLPVLDSDQEWAQDVNSGLFKTEPQITHRLEKVQKPIVLYPATPEHPAQTQLITEDVLAGYWNAVGQSGAMPKPEKEALVGRIEKVLNAVKETREEANMTDVEDDDANGIGEALFGFILGT